MALKFTRTLFPKRKQIFYVQKLSGPFREWNSGKLYVLVDASVYENIEYGIEIVCHFGGSSGIEKNIYIEYS